MIDGIIFHGGYTSSSITLVDNGYAFYTKELPFSTSLLIKKYYNMIKNDNEKLEIYNDKLYYYLDEILMRTLFIAKKCIYKEVISNNNKSQNLKDNLTTINCYKDIEPFTISYLSRIAIGEELFDSNNESNIAYEVLKVLSENTPCEIKKKLASNIILSGGMCMYIGFYARFEEEIKDLLDKEEFKKLNNMKENIRINKIIFPRNCLCWIGASLANQCNYFESYGRKIKVKNENETIGNNNITNIAGVNYDDINLFVDNFKIEIKEENKRKESNFEYKINY